MVLAFKAENPRKAPYYERSKRKISKAKWPQQLNDGRSTFFFEDARCNMDKN